MRLELVWADGISLNVEIPKKVTSEKFLAIVEEVEFLIKRRNDKNRLHELSSVMYKMEDKQQFVPPLPYPTHPQQHPNHHSIHPPHPHYPAHSVPQTTQPAVHDAVGERLDKLEKHTDRILSFLENLSKNEQR